MNFFYNILEDEFLEEKGLWLNDKVDTRIWRSLESVSGLLFNESSCWPHSMEGSESISPLIHPACLGTGRQG